MATKVKMPKISTNVEEETITGWFKKEGDPVRKGEPLLEVTTDKAVVEVETPRAGVLRKILAPEKSMLPVGYVVAIIGTPAEPLPDVAAENRRLLETVRAAAGASKAPAPAVTPAGRATVRATPRARKLAQTLGIDLDALQKQNGPAVITESIVRSCHAARH